MGTKKLAILIILLVGVGLALGFIYWSQRVKPVLSTPSYPEPASAPQSVLAPPANSASVPTKPASVVPAKLTPPPPR